RLGLFHGLDDLLLHERQIVRIDPARERVHPPQAKRVGPLMVVRAGDEDVGDARQLLADVLDIGEEEADDVDRRQRDLLLAVRQDDGAGEERVVALRGLAVVAEASDVDRFITELRRDVGLAETGPERIVLLVRRRRRGKEKSEQKERNQTAHVSSWGQGSLGNWSSAIEHLPLAIGLFQWPMLNGK